MKSQNIALLTQILVLVAVITEQGRYQVHVRIDGACQLIDIDIYPPASRWRASQPTPVAIATAAAYWSYDHRDYYPTHDNDQRAHNELTWLAVALRAYLQPEQLEQEAAA